jgi:hypothetical protein
MTKMEAEGFNVSAARTAHQEALTSLQAAETSLRTIDTEVAVFVGSSDPRTAWLRLETIYGTINGQVATAYAALRECLRQLEVATPTLTTGETSTSSLPE